MLNRTIYIPNTDIYYLKIEADHGNYASIRIKRKFMSDNSRDFLYSVVVDTIVKQNTFPGSEPSTKYNFSDVFKNPHKATVNSSGKNIVGFGENRVIIPVDLPDDTNQWIYRLTLSYRDKATETTLHDDMNASWSKVNEPTDLASAFDNPSGDDLMGKPIILQNQLSTLFSIDEPVVDLITLLYDKLNEVPKEDAYLNYFIIPDESNAKKFLRDEEFNYSIESSQRNIQSIEEIERKINKGHVYIGLENTNFKEQVYAKLEVVAIEEQPVYMKLERKLIRSLRN